MAIVTVKTATLRTGLRIPYAETGDPAGIPILFVHGYVESWRYFERVLERLPASLHGLAPTQRGHAEADRAPDGYRPEDLAGDLVDFMDALGVRRAVLVGTSSGGLVTQLLASRHPERAAGLVLVSSPATLVDKPGVRAMLDDIATLEDPLSREFVDNFVRSTSPESVPDEVLHVLVEESLKTSARTWKDTLRGLVDMEPVALEAITAPTLLISGDNDPFVSTDQDILVRGIPNARLTIYRGVGHAVHLAHPDRVVGDLVTFLAQVLPAGG